jgi:hypothetical protein
MADHRSERERDEETVAWLEREGIVTRSAQRLYFEQIADGLAPDLALEAALQFTAAEIDAGS